MTSYIPQLYRFLAELSLNNNREWWKEHKGEFDHLRGLWLNDLNRLIAAIAQWWPEVKHIEAKQAAYRIYRDTRFSLDKTPYKTYFSAAICAQGRSAMRPGIYLHMAPDAAPSSIPSGVYGGLWCPDSAMLRKLRKAIVDNIGEWEEAVDTPQINREFTWCGDTLKRAPQGWPLDHPQLKYLKMKEYGLFKPLSEEFFLNPDWPETLAEITRPLKPMIDFLNYSIDE